MPLHIVRDDITNMRTQAIVCPSNSALRLDGGAGGAVAKLAGFEKLQQACDALAPCPVGKAVVTPAFEFPAEILVHAVGPVWNGGLSGEAEALASSIGEALALAYEYGAQTLALPLMSAGLFGFPADLAIEIETQAIEGFLASHDMDVWLVLHSNDAIRAGRDIFDDIESYIDDQYADSVRMGAPMFEAACESAEMAAPMPAPIPAPQSRRRPLFRKRRAAASVEAASFESLEERLEHLDESFAQTVLRLIDERGMSDVEVYKRANMSRQLFAKIRKDDGYRPTKRTACALAFALELSYDDALALLKRAGFTLSNSSKFDIIIEYFLVNKIYDIYKVNEALFAFDQQLLS